MEKWILTNFWCSLSGRRKLIVILLIAFFQVNANAQIIIGQDDASNYSSWGNGTNEGYGFGPWDLWNDGGSSGHFIGSSTEYEHGDINSDGQSFGMYGHSGQFSNAQRALVYWGEGYTFSIEIAAQWRDGARGISFFNQNGFDSADEIWNFNISNDGYGGAGFSYYSDIILRFEVTQNSNNLEVEVTGSSVNADWTEVWSTNIPGQTLGGFRLYTGGDIDSDGKRNLYFNNLRTESAGLDIFWVNLQWPPEGTIMPEMDEYFIYSRVEIPGITNQSLEHPQVQAWIGFNDENSDPALWPSESWFDAGFNLKVSGQNRHEYLFNAADLALSSGSYYYASRFQLGDSGDFYYGGIDAGPDEERGGLWEEDNNISGVLRFGKNSVATGNWNDADTWDDGVPVEGEHVFIKATHTVTLNTNAQVNSLTIETGGTLTVLNNQLLTIGPDGNFVNNGTFNAADGTVELRGTSTTGGATATEFNNITVNGINVSLDFDATKVGGILELQVGSILNAPELLENSTLRYAQGGSYQRVTEWNNPWNVQISNGTVLNLNINDIDTDLIVQGDLTIDPGSSVVVDDGHTFDFIVNGDVILNGTLTLSPTIGSDMQVGGDWRRTGDFNPNSREVIFNGSDLQQIFDHTTFDYIRINNPDGEVILLNDIDVNTRLEVDPGALFNMSNRIVFGAGTFELFTNGTLKIGHPQGISNSGDIGNIQTTGNRTFAEEATYHYIGSSNQWSGNALPTSEADKVIIVELASDEVELRFNSGSTVLIASDGRLEIRSGTVVEGDTSSDISGRSIRGEGELVMKGGVFRFDRTLTSPGSEIRFPRLSGTYSDGDEGDLLGTIILAGVDDFQFLRSGRVYNDLIFRGAGTKVIPNATPDINGTVTIEDGVVNSQNYQFGKAETNLTMTGGRLINSSTGPSPDMNGTYNMTGGTIEFANNSATMQTIKGTDSRLYYNIDVTGTSVGNSGGNIHIGPGGTFTVKENGVFRINTVAIVGAGSFNMEPGSTFLYGSSDGIKSSGTTPSDGNIRVAGTRNFPQNANYGFFGTQDMVTGDGLPGRVNRIILAKNEGLTVTLSQNLEILNQLTLTRGRLVTNGHELYLMDTNPTALSAGSGNEDFAIGYIDGVLKRGVGITDVDYIFPIGRESGLQTTTIRFDNLVTLDFPTLTAQFRTDIPGNFYGNLPQEFGIVLINTLSEEGFWQIDAENITSATYDISLFARGFGSIFVPDGIRIVKRETGGEEWTVTGDEHFWGGTEFLYTFTQKNVVGFSEFAVGGNLQNNPLPVEWLSFTAQPAGGEVLLSWQTATETNNDFFTVLRSSDGEHFQSLGRLSGAGNSNQVNSYTFTDVAPLSGVNYYRVRQTDFDGQYDYSQTLAVEVGAYTEARVVAHNRQIHFHLPAESNETWSYRVYNLSGMLLYAGAISSASDGTSHILDVSSHQGQLLVVSLTGNRSVVTEKIMIR